MKSKSVCVCDTEITVNAPQLRGEWGAKPSSNPAPSLLQGLQHALPLINNKITVLYRKLFLKISLHQY